MVYVSSSFFFSLPTHIVLSNYVYVTFVYIEFDNFTIKKNVVKQNYHIFLRNRNTITIQIDQNFIITVQYVIKKSVLKVNNNLICRIQINEFRICKGYKV